MNNKGPRGLGKPFVRLLTIGMIHAGLLTLLSGSEVSAVSIPDTALEKSIRNALNQQVGEITRHDMESLMFLDASGAGTITDLRGLEAACNLEELYLNDNWIEDLGPLSGLNRLIILNLANNRIKKVEALSGLNRLAWLDLRNNWISDIRPLCGLPFARTRPYAEPALLLCGNYLDLAGQSPCCYMLDYIHSQTRARVVFNAQAESEYWGTCPVRPDGTVDSWSWLGELWVGFAPWVYCEKMQHWLYIPDSCAEAECGWIYVADTYCLHLETQTYGWVWSDRLEMWVYVPVETINDDEGWVLLVR